LVKFALLTGGTSL